MAAAVRPSTMRERPPVRLRYVSNPLGPVGPGSGLPGPALLRFPVAAAGDSPEEYGRGTGERRGNAGRGCDPYRMSCGPAVERLSAVEVSARSVAAAPGGTVPLGGAVADVVPASVGGQDGVEGNRQAGEVTVIDPAVVELRSQLREGLRPIAPVERLPHGDVHPSFDDLHRRPAGSRGAGLLPGAVPAGGRTPLGDRSTALRGDRPTAPPTGPRSGPSLATGRPSVGRSRGLGGRRLLRPLPPPGLLFPPLPLTFTQSGLVSATPAVSHTDDAADKPSVTRQHEFLDRRCKRCNPLRS